MMMRQQAAALHEQRHWWAIAALLLAQCGFVAAYVLHENTVHFWDYAMYHDWARELFRLWQFDGAGAAWHRLQASMADDYNLLYALPSVLSFALFGDTRLIFIVTNFLCFVLGWQLAMAWLIRRLFMVPWRVAMFWVLAVMLLVPPFWVPLLGGFPDHAASLLIVLALGLMVGPQRGWRYALLLGLCLGFAILLRRHYAYPALAVLATAAVSDGVRVVMPLLLSHGRRRQLALPLTWLRRLVIIGASYAVSGAAVIAVLALLAPDFLQKITSIDYTQLYQSYSSPPLVYLRITLGNFGLLLAMAVAIGLVLLWRRVPAVRQQLVVIIIAGLLSLGLFAFGPAHAGPHYMLHLLPVLCALGLIGLYYALRSFPSWLSHFALVIIMVALVSNTGWALWLAPKTIRPQSGQQASLLLSTPNPPERRADLPQLLALAEHLAATSLPNDTILIIGSSHTINQDIIARLLTEQLKRPDVAQRLLGISEVDGRGQPPFDALTQATIYVVPEKPQYHLRPEVQKYIGMLALQFPPNRLWSKLFSEDDASFVLQDQLAINIWRRRAWRPDMLAAAQQSMQDYVGQSQAWTVTQPGDGAAVFDENGASRLLAQLTPGQPTAEFFLIAPVQQRRLRLAMEIDGQGVCGKPTLQLTVAAKDGRVISTAKVQPVVMPGLLYQAAEIPAAIDVAYLSLALHRDNYHGQNCLVQLNNLKVEAVAKP
jgi:hypothetical protein